MAGNHDCDALLNDTKTPQQREHEGDGLPGVRMIVNDYHRARTTSDGPQLLSFPRRKAAFRSYRHPGHRWPASDGEPSSGQWRKVGACCSRADNVDGPHLGLSSAQEFFG